MAIVLSDVDAAITAINGGAQSFAVDGMSYSRANLNALLALRRDLISEQGRSGGARPLFRKVHMSNAGYTDSAGGTTPTQVINMG